MRRNPSPPTSAALLSPPSSVRKTVILLLRYTWELLSGISNCIHPEPGRARTQNKTITLWTTNVTSPLAFWVCTWVVWNQVHFAHWEGGWHSAATHQTKVPIGAGCEELSRVFGVALNHVWCILAHWVCTWAVMEGMTINNVSEGKRLAKFLLCVSQLMKLLQWGTSGGGGWAHSLWVEHQDNLFSNVHTCVTLQSRGWARTYEQ